MHFIKHPFTVLCACAVAVCAIPRVSAITITAGNPGNAGTDNVLFNDGSLPHSGSLVQGNFSGSGAGFVVNFTSASGNNQIQGSGGQATITGLTGNSPFTSLTFGLTSGATFTKAILNPDAIADGTINFAVNYLNPAGQTLNQSFALSGNGQNFFGIEAAGTERITSVTFSTGAANGFSDASQFRLGGFVAPPATNVPDSGNSLALLGAGLLALGLVRRRMLS